LKVTESHLRQGKKMTGEIEGILRLNKNHKATPENEYPHFIGELNFPGESQKRHVSLWVHEDKTGFLTLSGELGDSANDQMVGMTRKAQTYDTATIELAQKNGSVITVEPKKILLFATKQKQPVQTDTPEQAAKRQKRPDYWGFVNTGRGNEHFRLSVWSNIGRSGAVRLSGSVQPAGDRDMNLDRDDDEHDRDREHAA
jgi:hypothetical protein